MCWEMGFSALEIASTALSNSKIFRARGDTPLALRLLGLCHQWISLQLIFRDVMSDLRKSAASQRPLSKLGKAVMHKFKMAAPDDIIYAN
jgi:hypothetical protein